MNRFSILSLSLFIIGMVVLAGCTKESASNSGDKTGDESPSITQAPGNDTSTAAQSSGDDASSISQAARDTFQKQCSTCHGKEGDGKGPMAMALKPPARNWTDREWQKSTSDDDIRNAIVKGGQGVGKSAVMPAYNLPAEVVDELVSLIRSFRN